MRHSLRRTLIPILLLPLLAILASAGNPTKPSDAKTPSGEFVPAWAKSAIWYQIFPERFRNGDPNNDPTKEELKGSWPHYVPDGWKVSNWTGDWYELQSWEKSDKRGFYVHVQNRRYGGDLQGVIDKLDYLKDLGVTAVYFNPLFESPSLHKYDAELYHHIDNNFGPDPAGDRELWKKEDPADPSTWQWSAADKLFLRLLEEAHRRDIRVVIDGVFNHVGLRFWAFQDVERNQQRSAYKEWFTIKQWDDPETPKNEFDYEGWYGVRELPEIREDENGLVEPAARHVQAVVRRWMDPNGDGDPSDGIDGWRLDVAEKVNIRFWRQFRTWVRQINPDAYIVGEVLWEDWKNDKMFNGTSWLQGDAFDAVMNYRWAREAFLFFAAEKTRISSSEFSTRLQSLLADYPSQVNFVLMNLYDSHDTDRIGSRLLNADLPYDHFGSPSDNPSYEVRKPGPGEWRTQKLMALFQMTYLGAPVIYYGTEAGMWGADDPDCRKPMLWDDMAYSPERHRPSGQVRPEDKNEFSRDHYEWYRAAIQYRRAHPSLQYGDIRFLKTNSENDILAFQRAAEDDAVLAVFNASREDRIVEIEVAKGLGEQQWVRGLGDGTFQFHGNVLKVTVPAVSGLVIHQSGT